MKFAEFRRTCVSGFFFHSVNQRLRMVRTVPVESTEILIGPEGVIRGVASCCRTCTPTIGILLLSLMAAAQWWIVHYMKQLVEVQQVMLA